MVAPFHVPPDRYKITTDNMPSIRYASLDEYWPAVRARAFAAEVRSLGGGPGFTTPRRLTYAKNMEILAKWAGVPVNHMPWVNPITFAERLCSAAFSSPENLKKVMGKRAYSEMCYFHVNCSTHIRIGAEFGSFGSHLLEATIEMALFHLEFGNSVTQ